MRSKRHNPLEVVPNEEFVKAWHRSLCISDMIAYTGLSENYIYIRARRLRAAGVDLPLLRDKKKAREWDVDRLNRVGKGA